MKTFFKYSALILTSILFSCGNGNGKYDATGTFESEEIIVSSEGTGKLVLFNVEEGQPLKQNQVIGLIDTTQLYLKKEQLKASIIVIKNKLPDIETQLAAIQEQIKSTEVEKKRIENLVSSNAATSKQLDDINSQLQFLKKQLDASKSSLTVSTRGMQSEIQPLQFQIEQIQDQINKSIIKNPIDGTILTRYAKQNEITSTGRALYRIADLSSMTLRAYVDGNQLAKLKLGQKVKVFIDGEESGQNKLDGELYWISSKAEFTPKTIQTKDERTNLVYAVKVRVKNNGYIKIGMYGEVTF